MSIQAVRLEQPESPVVIPTDARDWREVLAPYARPRLSRSCADLLTSVVPYFLVSAGMLLAMRISVWIALALAPVSAVCLLRTYIIFHDCSHGSFLPSRRGNIWLGTVLGIVVVTPFVRWRHDHAVHHATSGDLDRRGVGDLPTLTVAEYEARSPRGQAAYRAFRNPLVMFGIGPLVAMIIGPRLIARDAPPRMRRSVLATDAVLAVLGGLLIWQFGVLAMLAVWLPAALLAGAAGIWLFYAQHQFEDAYWRRTDDWDYSDAALRGSSFLDLTPILRWATGNIGFHHVHHLSVRIPNYNLKRAHEESGLFDSVPVLTLVDGLRSVRLKLWDESTGRMVTFATARTACAPVSP